MAEMRPSLPGRRFGLLTPLVDRVFGKSRYTPASEEKSLAVPELTGGLVPYIEMFRLIRSHQHELAAGLYRVYRNQFPTSDLRDFVDYENRVTISGQKMFGRKNISVWVTPKEIEERDISRGTLQWKYPWFVFHYDQRQGEWIYSSASVHKKMESGKDTPGWKWDNINAKFDPNDPDDDWVREGAVAIEDLERTFGKFLHGAIASSKP